MRCVNRRQFIIAKTKYEREDFLHRKLMDKYYLSYQYELKVRQENDTILIGHAFSCVKEGEPDISDALNHMHEWAGRWIVIKDKMLFMDACGTLGVFYFKDNEGDIICSSSLRLIEEMFPGKIFQRNIVTKYGSH